MAGTGTKRITELTEASTVQSGDFIAVDSNARGTKKVSTDTLATSAALAAETNARAGADEQMSERMDGIEEQTALIQNPTKTLSGALCSFTDGANMPMVACTAEIVPKQSGTGTPSPDNVRPISGWTEVNVIVSPTQEATDGTTTTVNLGRTVYGGEAEIVGGSLTADRTIVDGGSLNWTYWYNNYFYAVVTGKTADTTTDIMCDIYPTTNGAVGTNGIFNVTANKSIAYICDTSLSPDANGASELKTKLSGHSIAYKLATPQTYTLTGQEIETLLGDNNVWADSGDVEITYRRDISIVINNLESALNG